MFGTTSPAQAQTVGVRSRGFGTAMVMGVLLGMLTAEGLLLRLRAPRIETTNTHGTGCTLSSAIATYLGKGLALAEAVDRARLFVRSALRAAPGFGQGSGPLGHGEARG